MTLFSKVKESHLQALRQKDKVRRGTLTYLISLAQSAAKEKMVDEPTDEMTIAAINKFIKNNNDLLENESLDSERKAEALLQISIVSDFLPKQLGDDELRAVIASFAETLPEEGRSRAMGLVMGHLRENHMGQYNAKQASSLAKEVLGL